MNKHKYDFLGRELKVGYYVVFIVPGYREYRVGRILAETPQYWRVSSSSIYQAVDNEEYLGSSILQTGNQLIRV